MPSDLGAATWSETDAANTAAPPDGFPEGMAPSALNNACRANMGAEKRWWNRINATQTTTGTPTAYVLTYNVAAAAYYDGEEFSFVIDQACGAAPTLNINGLGARPLRKFVGSWVTLSASDLVAAQVVRVRYDAASSSFQIIGGQSSIPTGSGMVFFGAVAPDGWLLCQGQAVSRTGFAGLFALFGTTYGAGDGSTTFNVPDLRGRVPAGLDGGTGRLPGFTALNAAGGQANQQYAFSGSIATSGSIGVTGSCSGNTFGFPGNGTANTGQGNSFNYPLPGSTVGFSGSISGSTFGALGGTCSGATDVRTNVQPTIAVNYIIKT